MEGPSGWSVEGLVRWDEVFAHQPQGTDAALLAGESKIMRQFPEALALIRPLDGATSREVEGDCLIHVFFVPRERLMEVHDFVAKVIARWLDERCGIEAVTVVHTAEATQKYFLESLARDERARLEAYFARQGVQVMREPPVERVSTPRPPAADADMLKAA